MFSVQGSLTTEGEGPSLDTSAKMFQLKAFSSNHKSVQTLSSGRWWRPDLAVPSLLANATGPARKVLKGNEKET